jgi:hypothetical protein
MHIMNATAVAQLITVVTLIVGPTHANAKVAVGTTDDN